MNGHQVSRSAFIIPVFILLCTMIAVPSPAAEIHVPAHQPTIQAGIDAAVDGDKVLVANGVYSGDGNRAIDFRGKAITVTSAGGANFCIIDCGGVTSESRHRGFIFQSGEGEKSVLQGFTIRNGQAPDPEYFYNGGAIHCHGASPRIAYNILTGNEASMGGAISCGEGAAPKIVGNIITGNRASAGGGIFCGDGSSPHIALNTISQNIAGSDGGGIACWFESVPTIEGNRIIGNVAAHHMELPSKGGGIYCLSDVPVELSGNEISGNDAQVGGGLYLISDRSTLLNNVFADNDGEGVVFEGGGDHTVNSCSLVGHYQSIDYNVSYTGPSPGENRLEIVNSILWGTGTELYVNTRYGSVPVTIDMSYCDVAGGQTSFYLGPNTTLIWGPGMIDADPRFADGPNGNHYLSQTAAGQALQSPCVDSGYFAGFTVAGTTRTDGQYDTGDADMGWHYRNPDLAPDTMITNGPDWHVNSPVYAFTFTGRDHRGLAGGLQYAWKVDDNDWSAYDTVGYARLTGLDEGAHTFSVRARDAAGRIDETPAVRTFFLETWAPEDRRVNIVTGPGPGPHNPPLVRTPQAEWLAYGVSRNGVNVACGNLDGDGAVEVITGPGPGPVFGPHIRCWTMSGQPLPGGSFMAYGTLRWGVNVAAGDIDGDGWDEIVTGAGPGAVFGPHVRAFDLIDGSMTAVPGISFFAYGTHRFGVEVTCGDIDGDGIDEIVTGPGPGPMFGPHVRAWNHDGGVGIAPVPGVSFFTYDNYRFGVKVACGDIDGDGFDEILTAPGPEPDARPFIRGWNVDNGPATSMPNVSFFSYTGSVSFFGGEVSAGDVDLDGVDEILTLAGPDPEAVPFLYTYEVEEDRVIPNFNHCFSIYDYWMTHGGNVAGIRAD